MLPDVPIGNKVVETAPAGAVPEEQAALRVGNREVVTDHYFHLGVENEPADPAARTA